MGTGISDIKKLTETVNEIAAGRNTLQKPVIIAIDGRCGAGKTTLAGRLHEENGWSVFHMDDFFLRAEQRTKERFEQPGGNVDHERFWEEILNPLQSGEHVIAYRPFDCKRQALAKTVSVTAGAVNIVEGSYSCHPALWDVYDLHVFLDVGKEEQERRILKRNGRDGAVLFAERWIPLEKRYFDTYRVRERCEFSIRNDAMP
ncbi:MAG: hypothetical protein NC409_07915 [Clostridium sp.]|nr:hypothetical protein [Clostridium sp.]